MAPAAIMLVSAAISAGGQAYSGMAANAEGKSAQNMANYNASLSEREAQMTEQKTAIQQKQQAGEAERRQSTMIANMGASGVVGTSGTPLLIQAQQAEQDELQNLMIGFEGAEQARGLRSEAVLQRLEGKKARMKGKAERTGKFIGAGSTLLSGFGQALGSMGGGGGGGGGGSGGGGSGGGGGGWSGGVSPSSFNWK
jgi:hypothetical protein